MEPGLLIDDGALDFKLQFTGAFKVSSSDSPIFIVWRFEDDCTPFNQWLEISVAIITFKSHSRRSVSTGDIENETNGVEFEVAIRSFWSPG